MRVTLAVMCDRAFDDGLYKDGLALVATRGETTTRNVLKHLDELYRAGHTHREQRLGRSSIVHVHPGDEPPSKPEFPVSGRTRVTDEPPDMGDGPENPEAPVSHGTPPHVPPDTGPMNHGTGEIHVRRKEARKERGPSQRTGTALPLDWTPDADLKAWARQERPDLDIERTVESFVDYWTGIPGAKGRKSNWPGAFKNWVKRERQGTARRDDPGDYLDVPR